jgi:hypothetical protein
VSSSSSSDYYAGVDFLPWREEEELKLEVDNFYENNPTIFDNRSNIEKEEILLDLVSEGVILADVAIEIAIREGLELE